VFPLEVSHSDNHPFNDFQDDKNKIKCGGYWNFSEANTLRMQDLDVLGVSHLRYYDYKARGPKHEHLRADLTAGSSFTHNVPHRGICRQRSLPADFPLGWGEVSTVPGKLILASLCGGES